jgi:ATP-dependent Lhr-like helicase
MKSEINATTIVRRYVQNRGPITSEELSKRYGFKPEGVRDVLNLFAKNREIVEGKFCGGPTAQEQQFIFRPNLERIHRQTISILRKEIKPSSLSEFTNFLFNWQKVIPSTQLAGSVGIQNVLEQMQGLSLPSEIWEREILFKRAKQYSRDSISSLTSSGQLVWIGGGQGKLKCVMRGEGNAFLPEVTPEQESEFSEAAKRVHGYLRSNGASFFNDIRSGTHLSLDAMNNGIAELFWGGMITNDVFAEIHNIKRVAKISEEKPIEPIDLVTGKRNPYRFRAMQTVRRAMKQVPGWSGRWSLVHLPGVLGGALTLEEKASVQAMQLLNRYGIVAREFYRREEMLPWTVIASEFQRMEMRGEIRRGYFVEGLSGMQFALPAAVEELRRVRASQVVDEQIVILNACDPANPFGQGVAINGTSVSRTPNNYIAFQCGVPVLLIEGNGARLQTLGETSSDILRDALRAFVAMGKISESLRPFTEVEVEYCNGQRPTESPFGPMLTALGFRREAKQTMFWDGYV